MATRKRAASSRQTSRPLGEYQAKRDFTRTAEPAGDVARATPRARGRPLRFVIQKHAASHLHYDFRLELDGVMKSWAVPKGPSLDPTQRRLAMEVEDHPIAYNTFEGTIPAGEYGGGTVMLWDRGTYEADSGNIDDLRRGYERGDMKITLHGERLEGSFALVRMRGKDDRKPQWLLIKHRDEHAVADWDIATIDTSVVTGRTMDEIAAGNRVWKNKPERRVAKTTRKTSATRTAGKPATRHAVSASRSFSRFPSPVSLRTITPMLATIGTEIPRGDGWTFEPKYDGVRVLAFASGDGVRLVTRNGKDKAHQFPEVTAGVRALAQRRKRPFVLDGEIVAFNGDAPARFQALQNRMHLQGASDISGHATSTPSALVAFDLLVDGEDVLISEPWTTRRKRLERIIGARPPVGVRLGDTGPGDGERLLARARRDDWEGIIAKRMSATYQPGARSRDWLKLKVEFRQEFVVGGYTEPRNTREHLGALLLGHYDGDDFVYVGHTGGGFTRESLAAMARRLRRLERKSSPFSTPVRTNEKAHWVRPEVVVEVKFNEWTDDNRLRQPIFLGVRDDKDAREVTREETSVQRGERRAPREAATRRRTGAAASAAARTNKAAPPKRNGAELEAAEREGRDAHVTLGRGVSLKLSSLDKVWFPGRAGGFTKGDVLRHYARVADLILPVMDDRPLVLKRFPDGINGEAFYQQKAPENPPAGVRVDTIQDADGDRVDRLVGGSLATLLYQVQLGTISVDPWHARVDSLGFADYAVIDLDPGPRAKFERVIEVAELVKHELDTFGLHAALKTSGATGLHVFIPLPARTSNESALLIAQVIATRVAVARPKVATVERTVAERPKSSVYVDYLQNVLGKSVAAAYAVRARPGATVSTPLDWSELTPKLDPRDFTIETVTERFARVGDIWAPAVGKRNTAAAIKGLTQKR